MTDYCCPECSCGFTKSAGKTRIKAPWRSKELPWYDRLLRSLMDGMSFTSYYVIQCPNCNHIFGDEKCDGDSTKNIKKVSN